MRVRRAGEGQVWVPNAEPGEVAASGLVLLLPAAFWPSDAAALTGSSLLGLLWFLLTKKWEGQLLLERRWPLGRVSRRS